MKMSDFCNFFLKCAVYSFFILLCQCDDATVKEEDKLLVGCFEINEIIHNAREYFENKLNAISCDDSPEHLVSYQNIYDDLSTIINHYIQLAQGIAIDNIPDFEKAKNNTKDLKQDNENSICKFSFSKYTINFNDDANKNVHLLKLIKLTSLFEFIIGNSIKKFENNTANSQERKTDNDFYKQYFSEIATIFAKSIPKKILSIEILNEANEKIVLAVEKYEKIDDFKNINSGFNALREIYIMFHNIADQYSECDDSVATVNTTVRKIYEKSSFETLSDFYKNMTSKNNITNLKQTIENIKNELDNICPSHNDNDDSPATLASVPAPAPLPASAPASTPATSNNNHKEEKEFKKYLKQTFERLKSNAEKYNGVIEILGPLACSTADIICGKNFPLLEIIKEEFEKIKTFEDPMIAEIMNSTYKKVNNEYFIGQKMENFAILYEMVALVVINNDIITKCFDTNTNIVYYIDKINAVSQLIEKSKKIDDSQLAAISKKINEHFQDFSNTISNSKCAEEIMSNDATEFTTKMKKIFEHNLKSDLWKCWENLWASRDASNEDFTSNFRNLSQIINEINKNKDVNKNTKSLRNAIQKLNEIIKQKKKDDFNRIRDEGLLVGGLVEMSVKYFLNELNNASCLISYGNRAMLNDAKYYIDDFTYVTSLIEYVKNIAYGIFKDFRKEKKKIVDRFTIQSSALEEHCNFLNNKYLLGLKSKTIDEFHWLRYYKFANLIQIIITNAFKKFEGDLNEEEIIQAIDFAADYLEKFNKIVKANSLKTGIIKKLWRTLKSKFVENVDSKKLKDLNDKLVSEIEEEKPSLKSELFIENSNIILDIYEKFNEVANEYKECSNTAEASPQIRTIFGSDKFVNSLYGFFNACYYEINDEKYPILVQKINSNLTDEKKRILDSDFSCGGGGSFLSTKLFAKIYDILYKRIETDTTILSELGSIICNHEHEICFPDFLHFSLVQRNWEDEFTDITNLDSKKSKKIKLFNKLANDFYCYGMWLQIYDIFKKISQTIEQNVGEIKKCGIKEENSILYFINKISYVIQLMETKITNQADVNNDYIDTNKFDEAKKLRDEVRDILTQITVKIIGTKSRVDCQSSQNENNKTIFGSGTEEELIEKFAIILKYIFELMTRDTNKVIRIGKDITGDPYSKELSNNLKEIKDTVKTIDVFEEVQKTGKISEDKLLAIDVLAEKAKADSDAVSIFDNFSLLYSTIIIFVNYLICY